MKKKILLVDDDEYFLNTMGKVLEKKYTCLKAHDDSECIEKLREYPDRVYALIIGRIAGDFTSCWGARRGAHFSGGDHGPGSMPTSTNGMAGTPRPCLTTL